MRGGISDHATFHVASVEELVTCKADIVVSLGLLDWLSDEDNRFKFHNDVERLLKGEDGDGEA